jgi:hypothetical protein
MGRKMNIFLLIPFFLFRYLTEQQPSSLLRYPGPISQGLYSICFNQLTITTPAHLFSDARFFLEQQTLVLPEYGPLRL